MNEIEARAVLFLASVPPEKRNIHALGYKLQISASKAYNLMRYMSEAGHIVKVGDKKKYWNITGPEVVEEANRSLVPLPAPKEPEPQPPQA